LLAIGLGSRPSARVMGFLSRLKPTKYCYVQDRTCSDRRLFLVNTITLSNVSRVPNVYAGLLPPSSYVPGRITWLLELLQALGELDLL